MRVKELIDCINIYDVKVIYEKPEHMIKKIVEGRSPIYFSPVEGIERIRYEKTGLREKFVSNTPAIHIIDLSIDELVNIFECDATGIHQFTKGVITSYCNREIHENVVYTIFLFLHEIGHWKQFEKMNRNVYDFEQMDCELIKSNYDKVNELKVKQIERIKKGNKCILTAKEKRLLQQYMEEYRSIPKEKEADEFALANMKNMLKLYVESI